MFAVFLIILALVGGSAATYFVMDGPRRRGLELWARAERDRRRLDRDLAQFEDDEQRLRASEAACERRAVELAARGGARPPGDRLHERVLHLGTR